jgi:Flp pilus assembly protein TadB
MMRSAFSQFARFFVAALFFAVFAVSQTAVAQSQDHLVSPTDLQQAAVSESQTRQQDIDTLDNFFSSAEAQQAFASAHINPREVKNAVSGLSDQELAQLATRASKAQADFAAGNVDNRDLLIIILCIAALILIIVAVH